MEYVSIRVSTLRGDDKIDFNVFIKINEKMILYLRQGDSFEGERLKRLKEKKLKKVFILTEEEARYRSYMRKNIDSAYDNKSEKSLQTRAEIIQGDQQNHVEAVFENPDDVKSYELARESAERYVNFVTTNNTAIAALLDITNTDGSLSHHGVNVAGLSIALAQKLGKIDQKTMAILSLGAFLHDFGLHDSGINIARPLSLFETGEMDLYKKHPAHGSEKIQNLKHFDRAVVAILAQHEELCDGTGYPKGLSERQIDPLAIIVSSANAMDRLISFENIPMPEAGKALMIHQIGTHPLTHLQHLSEIIKRGKSVPA